MSTLIDRTEQDKQMSCLNCGKTKANHKTKIGGACNDFRYDPHQVHNYRALCINCKTTGQAHAAGQGCQDFVPEPWDERRCVHCNHFGFVHKFGCLGNGGSCKCSFKKFMPKPAATMTGRRPVTPTYTLVSHGDGSICPRCNSAPANMYSVPGLANLLNACSGCAHAATIDALAEALPKPKVAPFTLAHGRHVAGSTLHDNCKYVGYCVAHDIDSSVKKCMWHVGPQG